MIVPHVLVWIWHRVGNEGVHQHMDGGWSLRVLSGRYESAVKV